ncbi:MAG: Fe(3+) ABC transporter substrate-binding protein [Alphaproteobacteria bacterium]|nr:Fe(3+) ABC transporter substrate-binding protein [Alphaproteobacteria bacterium]
MKHLQSRVAAAIAAGIAFAAFAPPVYAAGEVNIYSYRQEVLIRPLLARFAQATGIKVNVVFAKKGMIARLKAEGVNSPADVILTVDAGRLIRAKQAGVLQPIASKALASAVPAQYRDPEGYWFGLTVRGRPIIYAADRVKPSELSTYEGLASAKWKGRICIRSSGNIYNQSMLASMIAHNGVAKTEHWAKGFVANFARKPKGGDRDQIRAVAAGVCDIALANTYYLAGMTGSKRATDRKAARKVRIFWPNQGGRGTHVNISGAAVTKSSKNRANAVKLLEFLASDEAQRIYAQKVLEYPVKPGIAVAQVLEGWGKFKADRLELAELAKHNADAVKVADRAGWR